MAKLRPGVPDGVTRLVESCLEKAAGNRPQTANDVLLALDGAASQPVAPPRRRPVALIVAVVAAVLVVAALVHFASAPKADEPLTFAVVPFQNMTRDTSLDYRSDGIGDEILNGIGKVKGVQVVGRSAAFRFKNRTGANAPDDQAVERALGARLLLTGTLRESEGRTTISAQLSDSASHGEIWSESFSRASNDLASITDDIVRRVADTLRARFGERIGPRRAASSVGTTNAAALDHYLVGQAQLRRRGSGVLQSIESFQRAIALDPNFARAHAALANALELGPFFMGTPPSASMDLVVSEAERARALDSTLADAYVALALAHGVTGRWDTMDAEMRRAIQLDPDNAPARLAFARALVVRGEADEAVRQLERARKVEPTSPIISAWLGYGFFLQGRVDSALAETARAAQLDSSLLPVANLGALVNLATGRAAVARHLISLTPSTEMTNAAYVYAKAGDTAAANRSLRDMAARTPRPWFVDVSIATAALATGDTAAALSALERSARATGALWVYFIPLGDPTFDPIRRSPRFAALLRQANVDLHVVTNPRRGR